MTGAGTLPALSLPALAADDPDAGLLALGRKFDAAKERAKQADIMDAAEEEIDLLSSKTWKIAVEIFET
jgi:hypothetical protein